MSKFKNVAPNKPSLVLRETVDNATYKRALRHVVLAETGRCPICPWNGGENARKIRRPRYGVKKPRRKDKR